MWLNIQTGQEAPYTVQLVAGLHTVGREDRCVIRLNDRFVSRVHIHLILQPDGSLVLEDLGSMNGTLLNGQRMSGALFLKEGDRIQLGETVITVSHAKATTNSTAVAPTFDSSAFAMRTTDSTNAIHYRMRIGRDPANDLVISHPMVSRFHAEIIFKDNEYRIYDLGSINGVHVNGKRIASKQVIAYGDRIMIGGSTFSFQGKPVYESNDYTVRLQVRNLERLVSKANGQQETLLNNIHLNIEPREFVAILGESGAGKSTLLGALTGMSPATSGQVQINGRPFYEEYDYFRQHIGYVPQDDIVHKELTVYEVLDYSARLRLPSDFSENELVQRVNEVIDELELTARRDHLVKNLSGGQRKRVSIGVELLTKPSLFFLDEPTSGLDPGLEKLMMENLRKLADAGKTILMVTHATFNISLCDKVIILGKGGRLAFFGTPAEALQFFAVDDFADIYKNMTLTDDPTSWPGRYKRSSYHEKYLGATSISSQVSREHDQRAQATFDTSQTGNSSSAWKQWWLLTSRYATIMLRDRKNMMILLLQAVIIAALLAAVFYADDGLFKDGITKIDMQSSQAQSELAEENTRWNKMSLVVALMVFTAIWLGTSNAAREITKELPIYLRERRVYLRIFPYLMSKLSVLSLISIIQLILFLGILTVTLGIPNFFANLAAFFLITLGSIVMGLLVSAFSSNSDKAISFVPLLLVPQIILSGAIVPIDDINNSLIEMFFYVAISKWGYELVGGQVINVNEISRLLEPFPHDSLADITNVHWLVLVGFFIVCAILTIWAVKRKDKKS